MKISKRILILFLIIISISLISCQLVYASSPRDIAAAVRTSTNSSYTLDPTVASILGLILSAVQVAATGIFIIKLTMIGIKYFSTSALASVQAELKTQLRKTIIYGGLAMAAISILAAVFDAFS